MNESTSFPRVPAESEEGIIYHSPAEVFAYWYNKLRARSPGERPSAEEIHHASRLPVSTCKWYRQRYEAVFPDAYALSQVRENLKLSRRQLRRRRKKTPGSAPPAPRPPRANLGVLPPPPPCTSSPSVQ